VLCLLLQRLEVTSGSKAELSEIEAQHHWVAGLEPSQTFAHQNGGAPMVVALAMQLGHSDLKNPLQHRSDWTGCFMPQRL